MQKILAETEAATQALKGLASEPRGLVRLTAPPDLGAQQLPVIVAKVWRRHPGLVLELTLTNRVVDLVGEGIDLAIRAGHLGDSSLVARKVAKSELRLFAAPTYLDRRGSPSRPADLLHHECLCYGSRAGRLPWRLTGLLRSITNRTT